MNSVGAEAVGKERSKHITDSIERNAVTLENTELLACEAAEGVDRMLAALPTNLAADHRQNLLIHLLPWVTIREDLTERQQLLLPVLA